MMKPWIRLVRACAAADLTIQETAIVVWKVRRGAWSPKNNREVRAQVEYLRRLVGTDRG